MTFASGSSECLESLSCSSGASGGVFALIGAHLLLNEVNITAVTTILVLHVRVIGHHVLGR